MTDFRYVTPDLIATRLDAETLTQLTDDNRDEQPDENVVNSTILLREKYVEDFIASRPEPTLEEVRTAVPGTVQLWICNLVVHDFHGRRNNIPVNVSEDYQRTLLELEGYRDTGLPPLIVDPTLSQTGQTIAGNMSEEDLEWTFETMADIK